MYTHAPDHVISTFFSYHLCVARLKLAVAPKEKGCYDNQTTIVY